MNRFLIAVGVMASALVPLLPQHVRADHYNYSATLDLSHGYYYNGGHAEYDDVVTGGPSFNLKPGDTLSGIITFNAGQSIEVVNKSLGNLALVFQASTYFDTDDTSQITLIGPSGALVGGTVASGGYGSLAADYQFSPDVDFTVTSFTYNLTFTSSDQNASGLFSPSEFYAYSETDSGGRVIFQAAPEPVFFPLTAMASALLVYVGGRRHRDGLSVT